MDKILLLSFKLWLVSRLYRHEPLRSKIRGIFFNFPSGAGLPLVRLASISSEEWSAHLSCGKVCDISFEVLAGGEGAKSCLEIMDILEVGLLTGDFEHKHFVVVKVDVLETVISYVEEEEVWLGEVNARFWMETVH